MPTHVPAHKIILEGHIGSGEIFATGFWAQSGTTIDAVTLAGNVISALGATGTGGTTTLAKLKNLLATADGWDRVRVYNYLSGSLVAASSAIGTISGGTGAQSRSGAYQDALVVTLQTGQAGRSHRGRMYLPFAGGAGSNGEAITSQVDGACNAVGDLMSQLHITYGVQAVVYSQTLDQANVVTALKCDSKIDTQRRRAGKQQASYSKSYTAL